MSQVEKATSDPVKPAHPSRETPLGELLVQERLVGRDEIKKVLAIQEEEKKLLGLPLGQILVRQGKLGQQDLDRILDHPNLRKHLGALAVERKYVTQEQLNHCLQKKPPDKHIGQTMLEEGFLDSEALVDLFRDHACAEKLGDLAVRLNLVPHHDVEVALRTQKAYRSVGEICCDLGLINPLELDRVLNKYGKQSKLGEILINLGYLDNDKLTKALQEQQYGTDLLGDLLVRNKHVTRSQIQEAISKQVSVPFKPLDGFVYSEKDKRTLVGIIGQKYAEKNLILPISLIGKKLTVAILNPDKISMVRELKRLYGQFDISCIFISEAKYGELFEILYSRKLSGLKSHEEEASGEAAAAAEEEPGDQTDFMQIELSEGIEEGPGNAVDYGVQDIETEELVNYIIKYGITHGASDIHFEQDRRGAKLRYRIDGVLREVPTSWLRKKINEKPASIVSRIKVMSNLDISEKRVPQDGVFRINYYDRPKGQKCDLDFRVATCPAISGENITIRILDSRKANVGLEKLNHSPHVLDLFRVFLKSAAGMVLVTGPTGSGKSSTLYGALQYIYEPTLKIITAEDPIEYSFPGIMQTQVNQKIGLTFVKLLRSFLRLDPDVILVGEIRDNETAHIGFDAAQTGHLVLSTLHTNDAISTVGRLEDLGIDRAQIAASLSCVLAQRLVRRICPTCITPHVPEKDEWGMLFEEYPSHLSFFKGSGCDDCGFTGFSGRTLISELFVPGDFKTLAKGASVDDLKLEAVKNGAKTLIDDGLLKLGDTTLSEILRVVPHEMIQMYRRRKQIMAGEGPASEVEQGAKAPRGFAITDPAVEGVLIDQMFEEYQALAAMANMEVDLDRDLFGRFIAENHAEISGSSQCRQIIFHIRGGDDDVRISAAPLYQ